MSESTTPSVTESNITGQGDTRQASIANNNSNTRQRGNKYKNKKNEKAFKGNTRDMNGHVFETYYECRDETQFKKTLDMIGQYVNKHLRYPDDMEAVYLQMEEPEIKKNKLVT